MLIGLLFVSLGLTAVALDYHDVYDNQERTEIVEVVEGDSKG